uniref:Gsp_05 putative toxin n=1 Tax=Gemmula speciosa TaxID=439592 RepID=A0A098LXV7_GEMSP
MTSSLFIMTCTIMVTTMVGMVIGLDDDCVLPAENEYECAVTNQVCAEELEVSIDGCDEVYGKICNCPNAEGCYDLDSHKLGPFYTCEPATNYPRCTSLDEIAAHHIGLNFYFYCRCKIYLKNDDEVTCQELLP